MTKKVTIKNVAPEKTEAPKKEFEEKVVQIDRVTRTVKGGHRMRFRVLVVVGDKKGKVGYAVAKGADVPSAIKKAVEIAKKRLVKIPIVNETIPHDVDYKFKAAHIILMPARHGTSVIAGGPVRAVIEACGIKNILTKIIGTQNKASNVKATIEALKTLRS